MTQTREKLLFIQKQDGGKKNQPFEDFNGQKNWNGINNYMLRLIGINKEFKQKP